MNKKKIIIISSVSVVLLTIAVMSFVSTVKAQSPLRTQWEYLTVHYSQMVIERVSADHEPYMTSFHEAAYGTCEESDVNCIYALTKGRMYYLDILGTDGWELILVENNSTANEYSIDMILKRPQLPE
jgi:hypothetical protein